jgi:anti-sigma regulatory factor (Ser/Thr protein kinase)
MDGGVNTLTSAGLELALPPRRTSARVMRAALGAYLAERAVDPRTASEVVLAAEEALTNAIIHAGDVRGHIFVTASVGEGEVRLQVRDLGCGFDARRVHSPKLPSTRLPGGRGLFLIDRMMDRVQIRSGAHGTCVSMMRRIA